MTVTVLEKTIDNIIKADAKTFLITYVIKERTGGNNTGILIPKVHYKCVRDLKIDDMLRMIDDPKWTLIRFDD